MQVSTRDVIILSVVMSFHAMALGEERVREGPIEGGAEKVENVPAIELLEFLGEWADENGEEIDFDMLEQSQLPAFREEHIPTMMKR